jgi:hypothetical protein
MAANPTMPGRSHSSAPKFDPAVPRELRRYFNDLELLFTHCSITTDEAKKLHTTRYTDYDTAEQWELLTEYTDATKSYQDFKNAVSALYHGADPDRKWLVSDVETLIAKTNASGIYDLDDLGNYYRKYLAITTFLCSKNRLSETERCRKFVLGFQDELWEKIKKRLELKHPDQHPDDPYTLINIEAAAKYVLHSATPGSGATTSTSTISTSSSSIKTEDLSSFLDKFANTHCETFT